MNNVILSYSEVEKSWQKEGAGIVFFPFANESDNLVKAASEIVSRFETESVQIEVDGCVKSASDLPYQHQTQVTGKWVGFDMKERGTYNSYPSGTRRREWQDSL